jgi:3-hydroxyisobutyrate dehydrogenase-like beta-hydroxyacid dehydrogenase
VVGLGKMGTAIAGRLLDAGFPLAVGNRTQGREQPLTERGASWLPDFGAALAEGDVCVTSLSDDRAVLAAAGPILAKARSGTLLVETSTISLDASRRVAEQAAERGVDYVRAPISGNPVAVGSGTAAVFASGPAGALDRAAPVLQAISPKVRQVGAGDGARVLKLVLGVLIGGTAELLAEALVLGESAGLGRSALLEAIGDSAVGSTFVAYKTKPLVDEDYSATFTTSMMLKDIRLVLDLATETHVELPFAGRLQSLLESACDSGHAEKDFMSLLLQLEERRAS